MSIASLLLLAAASSGAAQSTTSDRCYVVFSTCSIPIPDNLKAPMATLFGRSAGCSASEVIFYGVPNAAIGASGCPPLDVRAIGGRWGYTVGHVTSYCDVKCSP
ncbi:hypothetical protein BFJ66_g17937 [Fusarium oxysporum f. sp. cepae]|uniref:Uncharacterized protein n=1 Tax=Fusarium oxysporum f. sp. cepae TaxID=396571 RepID=A0A3L6MTU8_FUSOX|nr:hypothetical protein BFJ65_g17842 [Fusarium oxysporum f. sp. cepae]RKK15632.1 hypothetical protein BFJ67_g17848 [Fusarium oxysporum f. sp. cepae]RKK17327.1 hypothetical protein BFJ66_g17937 [Fusarium oxysporum f. sp. cepae]